MHSLMSLDVEDGQDVNLFAEAVKGKAGPPGLPKFDPNRVVRGAHDQISRRY